MPLVLLHRASPKAGGRRLLHRLVATAGWPNARHRTELSQHQQRATRARLRQLRNDQGRNVILGDDVVAASALRVQELRAPLLLDETERARLDLNVFVVKLRIATDCLCKDEWGYELRVRLRGTEV